jgi:anthranilate synthase/aminodeoxychorismate synthase-like glutamine amidotransferase
MIDNYDSFTYNLVQYLGELGEDVRVYRNDQITVEEIAQLQPAHIVISPGPCTPNEAGVTVDTVRRFGGEIPLLGVCRQDLPDSPHRARRICRPAKSV